MEVEEWDFPFISLWIKKKKKNICIVCYYFQQYAIQQHGQQASDFTPVLNEAVRKKYLTTGSDCTLPPKLS